MVGTNSNHKMLHTLSTTARATTTISQISLVQQPLFLSTNYNGTPFSFPTKIIICTDI